MPIVQGSGASSCADTSGTVQGTAGCIGAEHGAYLLRFFGQGKDVWRAKLPWRLLSRGSTARAANISNPILDGSEPEPRGQLSGLEVCRYPACGLGQKNQRQGLENRMAGDIDPSKYQSAIRRAFVLFVRDGGCWQIFQHNSCLRRETADFLRMPNWPSAAMRRTP